MRLKSWSELTCSVMAMGNYGGLEVFDKFCVVLIVQNASGDTMQIALELEGEWVQVEAYNGRRGWIKWCEHGTLHRKLMKP